MYRHIIYWMYPQVASRYMNIEKASQIRYYVIYVKAQTYQHFGYIYIYKKQMASVFLLLNLREGLFILDFVHHHLLIWLGAWICHDQIQMRMSNLQDPFYHDFD